MPPSGEANFDMKVRLDAASKRILVALLASPKTPGEVSRIYGIPVATVWDRIRRLQELGFVHQILTFVDSAGEMRRYFEAVLPIDTSDEEVVVEL
jgi:DNA-binding Lrp family transcriptional regulator